MMQNRNRTGEEVGLKESPWHLEHRYEILHRLTSKMTTYREYQTSNCYGPDRIARIREVERKSDPKILTRGFRSESLYGRRVIR